MLYDSVTIGLWLSYNEVTVMLFLRYRYATIRLRICYGFVICRRAIRLLYDSAGSGDPCRTFLYDILGDKAVENGTN